MSLRDFLVHHEGYRKYPYICPAKKLTIGIGHNLTDNGLPDEIIEKLYNYDVRNATRDLIQTFKGFSGFSQNRQIALISLMFQLGLPKFLAFKNMISAIEDNDWNKAAEELVDSKLYREDKSPRTKEVCNLLRGGYDGENGKS